jgi:hypothetical protein
MGSRKPSLFAAVADAFSTPRETSPFAAAAALFSAAAPAPMPRVNSEPKTARQAPRDVVRVGTPPGWVTWSGIFFYAIDIASLPHVLQKLGPRVEAVSTNEAEGTAIIRTAASKADVRRAARSEGRPVRAKRTDTAPVAATPLRPAAFRPEDAAKAREVVEMQELLTAAGYAPVHAARLREEGMGPFELESRLRHAPGEVGSLPYTHGIHPIAKARATTPAAGDAPELEASRDKAAEPPALSSSHLDRTLFLQAKLTSLKPGSEAEIEGYEVRRVADDPSRWNLLNAPDRRPDEPLPLASIADVLSVPREVRDAAKHVARALGYPTSGTIPDGTPLPDAMDARAVAWINEHRDTFAELVFRIRPSSFESTNVAPQPDAPHAPSSAPAPLTNATFPGPATLYFQGDLGMAYRKLEARDVELFVRPYAQYSAAVRVRFIPKGARHPREMWLTYGPKLVILAGHGHPEPNGMWTAPESSSTGVTTQMSRHAAFSDEWEKEARDMLAAYVARSGARVLADFHGYDAHRRMTEAELAAWDAVRGDERREAY